MRPNETPSVDMLHSVGALMDTSYLRAAVADATGVVPSFSAPRVLSRSRACEWFMRMMGRRPRNAA